MKGLYIHIPFCKNKCSYCSFATTKNFKNREDIYIDALIKEMSLYKGEIIDTIYIGGGTPSLLKIESLYRLKEEIEKNFKLYIKEFSVENNPEDINDTYLKTIKEIGVNRTSIGVQTFDDEILKLINRSHNEKTSKNAIEKVKKYFENISIDLMLGLPKQNEEKIFRDINIFNEYQLKHISIYGLKVEENTKLEYQIKNKIIDINDEDFQADMYYKLTKTLKKDKIFNYEISNFAKKGFESIHNLKYWQREEYIGLGLGAHSLIGNTRYSNVEDFNLYIKNINSKNYSFKEKEILNSYDEKIETIILALRLKKGLNITKFDSKFNCLFLKDYDNIIKEYSTVFKIKDNYISVKEKFFYSLNEILIKFME